MKGLKEKVSRAGFRCVRCQKCCMGIYGDNTVAVSPPEIKAIMKATGMKRDDIVLPAAARDIDGDGRYHSFGWRLRKKPDGDCIFLERTGCSIYEHRPWICRTYPFSLDGERLEAYECGGLSPETTDAEELALALLERRRAELEEERGMLEKFEKVDLKECPEACEGIFIVHDSEGKHFLIIS